jgi:diacylglycerol kinase (ATP)
MRTVLIGNPGAGRKVGLSTNSNTIEGAVAALRSAGIDPDVQLTEGPGSGTRAAEQAVSAGYRTVIAAGGDGTVQEVAQALVGTDAILGIMPLGSIMNVARTLGIDRSLAAAAQVIATGRLLQMDVGEVKDRYFLEYASVGIDAALRPLWHRFDAGNWSALRFLIKAMLRYKSRPITIIVDDQELSVHALMTVVANTPYYGWAFQMHPEAKIDDGCFEVKIFNRFTAAELLFFGLQLRLGLRPHHPKIRHVRGKTVTIASGRPLAAHADLQPIGRTPLTFRIVPGALRVWASPALWQPDCRPSPVSSTAEGAGRRY